MERQEHTPSEQARGVMEGVSPSELTEHEWARFPLPLVNGSLGKNPTLRNVHKETTKNFLGNTPRNCWWYWQNLFEHPLLCIYIIFVIFFGGGREQQLFTVTQFSVNV